MSKAKIRLKRKYRKYRKIPLKMWTSSKSNYPRGVLFGGLWAYNSMPIIGLRASMMADVI